MDKGKIGVGITTYNSEEYYDTLYNSLPLDKIDILVTVNGGDVYKNKYASNWIQHIENVYPSVCRNDCINFLLQRGCEHIFIIEDDMILKSPNIFDEYINASKEAGLKYFSFVSTSWESGTPGNRTPRLTVEYKNNVSISFYKNMCNEFTYHHRSCYEKTGLYDTNYRDPWDIDMAYRESQQNYAAPFWWFADITSSDKLIINNPNAVSRLQGERADGSREQRIQKEWQYFAQKHGVMVNQILDTPKEIVIQKLKSIKKNL
jgi:glycosyltransferase involved in cell wall biosynthesis